MPYCFDALPIVMPPEMQKTKQPVSFSNLLKKHWWKCNSNSTVKCNKHTAEYCWKCSIDSALNCNFEKFAVD